MKYWEIIADNLAKQGWSWGYSSYLNDAGSTLFVVDANRDDGTRYIVRSDELLTAFLELEEQLRRGEISNPNVILSDQP